VWNFKKKKNRSPLPQGDHTPAVRVMKPSHHPDLGGESTTLHPYPKGNSKILEGNPLENGNEQPPSAEHVPSNFASVNPKKVRARQIEEPKSAIDRRIDVALEELPQADDADIRACVSGASIDDVRRRRAARSSQ
jgi:hypothetical protein